MSRAKWLQSRSTGIQDCGQISHRGSEQSNDVNTDIATGDVVHKRLKRFWHRVSEHKDRAIVDKSHTEMVGENDDNAQAQSASRANDPDVATNNKNQYFFGLEWENMFKAIIKSKKNKEVKVQAQHLK